MHAPGHATGDASGRPHEVTILAVGQLVCAGAFLLAALVPPSPSISWVPDATMAIWAAVTGATVWWFGTRLGSALLHVTLVSDTVVISSVVYRSTTEDAAVITTFGYPWLALYAAIFFSARAMRAHLALIAVLLGFALALADLPRADSVNKLIIWLLVVITTSAMAIILARLVAMLRWRAERDDLTSLLNRRAFYSTAEQVIAAADRNNDPITIAILDLDSFKQINDTSGHEAGDRALAAVAAAWTNNLRDRDVLGRLGGDEFALLMPGTGVDEAQSALARLRVASTIAWSAGMAERRQGESMRDLLSRADADLYLQKRRRQEAPAQQG